MPEHLPGSRAPGAYRGRFAPSPTGPLHFGSLIAAVASYVDARVQGGEWLVRIEDIDRPREVPGAADEILRTVHAFGLAWDGPVIYQSRRTPAYQSAMEELSRLGLTYVCGCSRAEVARLGRPGIEGPVYPGTCRDALPAGRRARSVRFRCAAGVVRFSDRIQSAQQQSVADAIGDFVLRRADGIHAYQLAVIVDDAEQGVTDVVRGADLLLSTPRQILLQRALGVATPRYAHVPLVLDGEGRKLSKSLDAAPVDPADPLPALARAWALLGQPAGRTPSVAAFWRHAISSWCIERVPARTAIAVNGRDAGR